MIPMYHEPSDGEQINVIVFEMLLVEELQIERQKNVERRQAPRAVTRIQWIELRQWTYRISPQPAYIAGFRSQ